MTRLWSHAAGSRATEDFIYQRGVGCIPQHKHLVDSYLSALGGFQHIQHSHASVEFATRHIKRQHLDISISTFSTVHLGQFM